MRSFSYLNTARQIISSYDGKIPFTAWLKQFFKTEKKFGSTDRKQISHLCYCYFRLGGSFTDVSRDNRFLIALFLCSTAPNFILREQQPEWNDQIHLPLKDKLQLIGGSKEVKNIFPFNDCLSDEIDEEEFNLSILVQPDLFLRARPGKKERVSAQLKEASVEFETEAGDCFRIANQSKIDELLNLDRDVVVQDLSSQQTSTVLLPFVSPANAVREFYDCCAASGGKSIMLHDLFPSAEITVSDIRESILINLRKRFQRAGITRYQSFVADISKDGQLTNKKFDLVVCDAPCSGSGTWSRTPDQMAFFSKDRIEHYSVLQKTIASNAIKSVKPDGYFLYITCSVFAEENEEVVNYLQAYSGLNLLSSTYFKGYGKKADSLFAALFGGFAKV